MTPKETCSTAHLPAKESRMAQTIKTYDDHFVCPYCIAIIHVRNQRSRLDGGCEHLTRVDGGRKKPLTGHFVAPDEYLVPDADCYRTGAWVYVKTDDPRYLRAYKGGHLEPGDPAPTTRR